MGFGAPNRTNNRIIFSSLALIFILLSSTVLMSVSYGATQSSNATNADVGSAPQNANSTSDGGQSSDTDINDTASAQSDSNSTSGSQESNSTNYDSSAGENSTSSTSANETSDQSPPSSNETSASPSETNSTDAQPGSGNATSPENEQTKPSQNSTDTNVTSGNNNSTDQSAEEGAQAQPVNQTQESSAQIVENTTAMNSLAASDSPITRSFSYPVMTFQGDDPIKEEVKVTWNLDGTTMISDNRGYQYSLQIPLSDAKFTLLENKTAVVQRVTAKDYIYDISWLAPEKDGKGAPDSFKYTISGSSINGTVISLIVDDGGYGQLKDNKLVVGEPYEIAKANEDDALKAPDLQNWTAIKNKDEVQKTANDAPASDGESGQGEQDGLVLDWSDAAKAGYSVEFDSTASVINISVGKSFDIDPTVVTTTTLFQSPHTDSSFENENRLITIGYRINAFYYDGSNIVYRTSDDEGKTWSTAISTGSGTVASDTYRWTVIKTDDFNGNDNATTSKYYVSVLYFSPAGSNMNFYSVRGTANGGTTLTWESPVLIGYVSANSGSCSTGGACAAVSAATDMSGNIYSALRWLPGGSSTYSFKVVKSTDAGATWSTSLAQVDGFSTARIPMALTKLDGGMLLTYAKVSAAKIYYRVFDGTSWGAEQYISDSSLGTTSTYLKELSATTTIGDDGAYTAYVAYTNVTTSAGGGILKVATFFGNGTFSSIQTADSSQRHNLPSIMITENGDLNINSISNGKIYDTRKSASTGAWEAPFNPYGTSFTSPDELTANLVVEGMTSAFWKEGTSSPYNMKFALLPHGFVSESTIQQSPGLADYFDGERRVVGTNDGTLFAFYYDGSNIVYKTSTDFGHTWSAVPTSAGTGQISSSDTFRWTVLLGNYTTSPRIALLYYAVSGSNTNFYAKTFSVSGRTLSTVGTTSLFSAANDGSCSPTGVCGATAGNSDSKGVLYAAFSYKTGGSFFKKVYKSSDGGQTWPNSLSSSSISTTGPRLPITLTSLSGGKMLLVWAKYDSSSMFYRIFDGTSWGSSVTQTGMGWSTNTVKQISSDTVRAYNVNGTVMAYVAYLSSGNHGSLKVAKFFGNGTYQGVTTADATLDHWLPAISVSQDDIVHIYTFASSIIYETVFDGASWQAPVTPYGTDFQSPDQLTSQIASRFSTGVIWRERSSSPYMIIYEGQVATSSDTISYLSVSAGNAFPYEGQKRLVKIGSTLFLFFDSGGIYYQGSTNNGASWGSKKPVAYNNVGTGTLCCQSYRFTIAYSNKNSVNHIVVFYWKLSSDSIYTNIYRWHGTVSGSTITWDNSAPTDSNYLFRRPNANVCGTGVVCPGVTAATAANNDMYAAFQYQFTTSSLGSTYYYRIYKSTDGGVTFSLSLSGRSSTSPHKISMALTRMGSDGALFAFTTYENTEFTYWYISGGSWHGSYQSTGANLSTGHIYRVSAASDSSNQPYLAYSQSRLANLKVARWTSTGSQYSPFIKSLSTATGSNELPSIAFDSMGDAHVFYIDASFGGIGDCKQLEGSWMSNCSLIITPLNSYNIDQLTAALNFPGVIWKDTSSSYKIFSNYNYAAPPYSTSFGVPANTGNGACEPLTASCDFFDKNSGKAWLKAIATEGNLGHTSNVDFNINEYNPTTSGSPPNCCGNSPFYTFTSAHNTNWGVNFDAHGVVNITGGDVSNLARLHVGIKVYKCTSATGSSCSTYKTGVNNQIFVGRIVEASVYTSNRQDVNLSDEEWTSWILQDANTKYVGAPVITAYAQAAEPVPGLQLEALSFTGATYGDTTYYVRIYRIFAIP